MGCRRQIHAADGTDCQSPLRLSTVLGAAAAEVRDKNADHPRGVDQLRNEGFFFFFFLQTLRPEIISAKVPRE